MRRLANQGGIRVGLVGAGAALGLLLVVACSAAATDSPTPTKAASAGAPTSTPRAALPVAATPDPTPTKKLDRLGSKLYQLSDRLDQLALYLQPRSADVADIKSTLDMARDDLNSAHQIMLQTMHPVSTEAQYVAELSATETGRRYLFSHFLAGYLKEGASPYLRSALNRRFQLFSNIFELQHGLGDIPKGQTFLDFLARQTPLGEPDPSYYRALVNRAAQLLAQPPQAGESEQLARFRNILDNDLERQYSLALELHRTGSSRLFESSFEKLANRNFLVYRMARGLGQQSVLGGAKSFLDFAEQGGIFGQTTPEQFRDYATQAAKLLTGPDKDLAPEARKFREELLANPEEQFRIGLQVALEEVSPPFRHGYSQIARRAFERYPVGASVDTPFLAYLAGRGFRF